MTNVKPQIEFAVAGLARHAQTYIYIYIQIIWSTWWPDQANDRTNTVLFQCSMVTNIYKYI